MDSRLRGNDKHKCDPDCGTAWFYKKAAHRNQAAHWGYGVQAEMLAANFRQKWSNRMALHRDRIDRHWDRECNDWSRIHQ